MAIPGESRDGIARFTTRPAALLAGASFFVAGAALLVYLTSYGGDGWFLAGLLIVACLLASINFVLLWRERRSQPDMSMQAIVDNMPDPVAVSSWDAWQAQQGRLDALVRLRDVIDGVTEFSIIATDIAGTIEIFSAGAARLSGYDSDAMVGHVSLAALYAKEELADHGREILVRDGRILSGFDVLVDAAREGRPETLEWTWIGKEGKHIPVQVSVTCLQDHLGRTNGFLAVGRDVTRDRDARRILEDARTQAERECQLKGQFVANMSHELRTPMNAVLGLAQLLETTHLGNNQRHYLDMIQKSGRSLVGIIDDILDFAKIESGKLRIDPVSFRLDEVLEHLANICAVAAQGKRLDLSMVVDPEVPLDLVGDSLRLQQVLVNLGGNAVKFTEKGAVTLQVDLLGQDGESVDLGFRIRDTGIGMTDEQQRRIFQPFSQADGSTTRRFGGTGLGLSISKHLVEKMGGRIGLRSKLGEGTEFFVSLTFPVQSASRRDPIAPSPADVRLLVVDDDANSRQGIEWAAQRFGWTVVGVPTLDEAVSVMRTLDAGEAPFSAMLVDIWLPGWEERDGIGRLREACPKEIPLIRLADFTSEGSAKDALRVMDGILIKPVTPIALADVVAKVLEGRVNDEIPMADTAATKEGGDRALEEIRILLVEDNAFNQVVASETLRMLGAKVDLADNGRIACELLEADPCFDVVIMDVQMPVMDGYAATRRIRETIKLDVPILAMTAGVLPSDRERCIAVGMDDFVTKPFQLDVLQKVILKHIEGRGRQAKVGDAPTPTRSRKEDDASPTGVVPGVFEPYRLVEMLGTGEGSEATVRKLVGQFLELTPRALRGGRDALERGDAEESMRAYHNLKSTAASLGARALSDAAREAEAILCDPGGTDPAGAIGKVEAEFERVEIHVRRWLSTRA